MRSFAVLASLVMVLVAFSQNVGPSASASSAGGDDFEEQSRRLTVAGGVSKSAALAPGARGSVQLAWADGRSGSLGVYHKATRDDGFTFSGDRSLAAGFLSIGDLSLASLPQNRTVAVGWSGTIGPAPSRVFVRASADDGATWGLAFSGTLLAFRKGVAFAHYADDDVPNPFEFVPSSITLILLFASIANFARAATGLGT